MEERKVFEQCDNCGEETELIVKIDSKGNYIEYGGYCKECGKFLLACSMCDMDKVNCSECKFEKFKRQAYLKECLTNSFDEKAIIKDLMNLIDNNILMNYIKETLTDLSLDELREDIFKDLSDDDFVLYMQDLGYNIKNMDDYNKLLDLEGRDLEQELYYYQDIVYDYEVKRRRDLEEYVFALNKITEIKGLMAELEE